MFLPGSRKDMTKREWDSLDFIYISGEAVMDHPSLGQSVICRLLEAEGYRVGIISQPRTDEDYKKLGEPNIAFLVSSGVIDSMVNNYTVAKRKRTDDAYSEGNKGGKRPDRAVIVYSNKLRELFPDSFIIIGGTEASLRRFAHYDYWADRVMKSILVDSKADLLSFGMGEKTYWEICSLLKKNVPIEKMKNIFGTCVMIDETEFRKMKEKGNEFLLLPSFDECIQNKKKYAEAFKIQYQNQDSITGKCLFKSTERFIWFKIRFKHLLSKENLIRFMLFLMKEHIILCMKRVVVLRHLKKLSLA